MLIGGRILYLFIYLFLHTKKMMGKAFVLYLYFPNAKHMGKEEEFDFKKFTCQTYEGWSLILKRFFQCGQHRG